MKASQTFFWSLPSRSSGVWYLFQVFCRPISQPRPGAPVCQDPVNHGETTAPQVLTTAVAENLGVRALFRGRTATDVERRERRVPCTEAIFGTTPCRFGRRFEPRVYTFALRFGTGI